MRSWLARRIAVAIVAVLLLAGPVSASPESREWLVKGHADLLAGRYADALEKFRAARTADATDADAWFFEGVALTRLGRNEDALVRLEKAKSLGVDHPDLDFEIGWGLLGTPRWRDAIAILERYEAEHPGRGQTSEFLGRAYFHLGQYEKSERLLLEAVGRAPALKPTVLYYLALIEQQRGNPAAARRRLQELVDARPDAPLVTSLRERLAEPAAGAPRPWQVAVSASGGYNSNVIALGERVRPPADISGKRSGFARFTLDGSHDWRLTSRDALTAGYGFLADTYERIPTSDAITHSFYVTHAHRITPDLTAGLRLSDDFSLVDGSPFRNQWSLRPAVAYRLTDWSATELAYTYADNQFLVPSYPRFNRDGSAHTAALTGYFAVPGTAIRARLGYFHVWNNAEGAEFIFHTDGLVAAVSVPLAWQVTADVSYVRSAERYERPSSFAGPSGLAFRRKDDVDSVGVEVRRPLTEWLRIYARYDFTNDRSNIPVFRYRQHVTSAGVGILY